MLKNLLIISAICLVSLPTVAQKKNDLKRDTTSRKKVEFKKPVSDNATKLPKDSTKKEANWKFLFSFDARTSFINFGGSNSSAKIFGIKIGATYKDKHRLGFGFYGLRSDKTPIRINVGEVAIQDTITGEFTHFNDIIQRVDFGYSSIFYEYVFYQERRWEFSVPLTLGSGTATVYEGERTPEGVAVGPDSLIGAFTSGVLGLSVGGHYKVMPWIGVGAGLGYRLMLTQNRDVRRALNSPIFIIKVKLFLGDAYKSIFKRKKGYRIFYKNCVPCKEGWDQ